MYDNKMFITTKEKVKITGDEIMHNFILSLQLITFLQQLYHKTHKGNVVVNTTSPHSVMTHDPPVEKIYDSLAAQKDADHKQPESQQNFFLIETTS